MTGDGTTRTADVQMSDPWEMALIHRLLRGGLAQARMAVLTANEPNRVPAVATYVQFHLDGLRVHHSSEDELVWPRLNERASLDDALGSIIARLDQHLDEEERDVVPLIAQHLTADEWTQFGELSFRKFTPEQRVTATGEMFATATPAEATRMLSSLPVPVRLVWRMVGQRRYDRFMAEVRGRQGATRWAGLLCLAAGVLGAASGLYLALATPQVAEGRYSYPLTAGGFTLIQLWFAVHHLGLLAGQYGLMTSGVAGGGSGVRRGHWLGLGGTALLAVTEVLAVTAANEPYPGPGTGVLDALYGVASVAIGVGLLVVGLGVRRHGALRGWRASVPLAIGAWVFVPMMPALMMGHIPARLSITGWMLLYAMLGWALLRPVDSSPAGTSRSHAGHDRVLTYGGAVEALVGWTLVAGFVFFVTGAARWRREYERPLSESLPTIQRDRRRRAWIHLWMMPAMVLTTAGLAALPPLVGDGPGVALATGGFVAYALGAMCMLVSLAFRLTVMPWAAEQTVATGEVPALYVPLDRWVGLLYVVHMSTAYATFAIVGAALLVGGAQAAWLGWLGVGLGLLGLGGFAATKAAGPLNPPILAHLWTLVVGIVLLF